MKLNKNFAACALATLAACTVTAGNALSLRCDGTTTGENGSVKTTLEIQPDGRNYSATLSNIIKIGDNPESQSSAAISDLYCGTPETEKLADGSIRVTKLKCEQKVYDNQGYAKTFFIGEPQSGEGESVVQTVFRGRPGAKASKNNAIGVIPQIISGQCRLNPK